MKREFITKSALLCLMMAMSSLPIFAQGAITIRFVDEMGAPLRKASATLPEVIRLDGTGASTTIAVVTTGLTEDIQVSVTSGFSVTPETIQAGEERAEVTITHLSTKNLTTGRLILRSGDIRTYMNIEAKGTVLPMKDLSQNPVYKGGEGAESRSFDASSLTESGYTIELRARTDSGDKQVLPYAVTEGGLGFKGYVKSSSMGLKNSDGTFVSEKGISNPANGGTFYNTDGEYHTYRYAVTGDRRVFVYRDGMAVDTFRVADLALQPEWSERSGAMERNLIKNGDFEGEWDFSSRQNITKYIEGWDVYPYDQYNSYQDISSEERSNEVDQNNHVLSMHRYMWEGGWADGEISQIVDVAPDETYSFSALAKGGIRSNGDQLGSIRIQDLQNDDNRSVLRVTSDGYQTYATDFQTRANTKQVRIWFNLERAAWGASVSAFKIDDVRLTGVSRIPTAQVGFESLGADVEYFSIDGSGAYAPLFARLETSADELTIDGTNASKTFTVHAANLTTDISVSATAGFEVSPATLPKGTQSATVTVKSLTTRNSATGSVILRSGDMRRKVKLLAHGDALPVKDLSQNPVYRGGEGAESRSFDASSLTDGGYTIELRARTDSGDKQVLPYAVTEGGLGFKGYVKSSSMGLKNSDGTFVSEKGISNPANGGTFYNTDGEYHTYRYAVTGDRRVFVYRDGMAVDTFRVADLALQPEWSERSGAMERNLIKNGDFEGEWDFSSRQNITKYIEGWDVYPYDQYNSYQDISSEERSNEVDQNNHVLSMHRYMWEGGWADGEISQIVDVAPDETYSFSALAKGGIRSNGDQLGSIRIQDLQNDDNRSVLRVTSDGYQTYATDFQTRANTKQVRIWFNLERAAWGASVSAFKIDDVRLTGVSRIPTAQVGFESLGADVEYFSIDGSGAYAPLFARLETSADELTIDGTNASKTFTVHAANLTTDISVSATAGFEVSPATLPKGTQSATVTVKSLTTRNSATGSVILRSGDMRRKVKLLAHGDALPVKDLSQNPVYRGGEGAESRSFDASSLTDGGYTIELRARTDSGDKQVLPYAVTEGGLGFKGYVKSSSMGLKNSDGTFVSEKGISNPANGGTFYNTDGEYHTYRYAVTGDRRVFVYRDGMAVDTFRVADLALQPEWSERSGAMERNLIKNGDFEGEWDFSSRQNITKYIEGWDVYPYDQYNSYQDISSEERSNEVDQNNHVLSMHRYMWEGGWADGEISQIVDVAPDETYSFSALAKGGIRSNGDQLGSIRIQDLQNDDNRSVLRVTSDGYQTYATDFQTRANTKQVRIWFNLERAAWGASVSAFKIDDVRLTGVKRIPTAQVGFENLGADVEYFSIDGSGVYAPLFARLETSVNELTIDGTNASETFTIYAENLTTDISVTPTYGFSVSPTIIKAGTKEATIKVKNLTTLISSSGKVILRSGDMRKTVKLIGLGTALPVRDLSQNPIYTGKEHDDSHSFDASSLTEKGYTVEIKARTENSAQQLLPYAVTRSGLGFKSYVKDTSMGMKNSKDIFISEKGISNPANGGTFYNTDGLYHIYRYAVTADKRIFVYRDGLPVDTFRVADLALQPEWCNESDYISKNLLKNGDFEGEWNFSKSQNITKYIEGWDVYPYDQYNSYQDIVTEERSNEVDQNNHVLSIHRYMWEGGWADGEISQIVDVAPDDIYTFSALAKGGIRSNGDQLGSIRIQDLQNDDNKVTMRVNSDSYKTYSVDFETKANTKQIRIWFNLERAAWGASVSAFKIDDARLIGTHRVPTPQIGFESVGADVEYFNFDATGAYAPALPGLTVEDIITAIRTATDSDGRLSGHIVEGVLTLTGAEDHSRVVVYQPNGRQVVALNDYELGTGIGLPGRGIYVVAVIRNGRKQVLKIAY